MALNSQYRRNLLGRRVLEQGGLCCYCKRRFTADGPTRPTIEHRKARMDGGRDCVANLMAACWHCNSHRGRQMQRDRARAGRVAREQGQPVAHRLPQGTPVTRSDPKSPPDAR
jgi:5-methylcytosine-specific restriction endonuclease McrA